MHDKPCAPCPNLLCVVFPVHLLYMPCLPCTQNQSGNLHHWHWHWQKRSQPGTAQQLHSVALGTAHGTLQSAHATATTCAGKAQYTSRHIHPQWQFFVSTNCRCQRSALYKHPHTHVPTSRPSVPLPEQRGSGAAILSCATHRQHVLHILYMQLYITNNTIVQDPCSCTSRVLFEVPLPVQNGRYD